MGVKRRAIGCHRFDQRFGEHRVKGAQRRVLTHQQMRFGSQTVDHACQFHGDVACAHYCHTLRQRGKLKETVRVDAIFRARNTRAARTTAGGDQNVIGGDRLAVHFHGFCVHKAGEATDHINVILVEHVFVRGVNAVDVGGAAGDQLAPVEFVNGSVKTVVRAVKMNRFGDLRRMPHHLFRDAADVNAGAAQFFGFNQGALLAVHRRAINRGDTAAAAADGEIIIMLCHDRSLSESHFWAL